METQGSFSNSLAVATQGSFSNSLAVETQGSFSNSLAVETQGSFSNSLAVATQGSFSNSLAVETQGSFGVPFLEAEWRNQMPQRKRIPPPTNIPNHLKRRAKTASRKKFEHALKQVPNVPPSPADKLP